MRQANELVGHDRIGASIMGGRKMPQYHTLNWEQDKLRLWLRPKGIRSRWFKCLPYLTGGILNLEIYAKSRSGAVQRYEYQWQLQELLPDKTYVVREGKASSFETKPLTTVTVPLGTYLIQHSGEYHLLLILKHAENQDKQMTQTVLNFDALARDNAYVGWANTLFSGIIGAILGGVVGGLLVYWIN